MIARIREFITSSLEAYWYKLFAAGFVFRRGLPRDMREKEFEEIYNACKAYTMTSPERMYALYKAVIYVIRAGIPGDFVECGAWRGGSAMLIALTLLSMNSTERKIYVYDTFAGMTKPGVKDVRVFGSSPAKNVWRKMQKEHHNEWAFASLQEVKKNLAATAYPAQQLVFVQGKVEETIPKVVPSSIALLRLDTDWYESTIHELRHLFPLLAQHGVLLIDDYGCFQGAKEAVDTYIQDNNIPLLLQRVDYTGRIGVKIKK
ncbi:MAG: class I SAM-dependent methyltransferase [Candidatus Wildermuthbacteria bacterium]|nr:class I SAM-dependent methyltransferase [Candidatus Wildermuthbacteria bacterium]